MFVVILRALPSRNGIRLALWFNVAHGRHCSNLYHNLA